MRTTPFVLVVLLFCARAVSACPFCVTQPLKFAYQDSEAFFVGRVVSVRGYVVELEVTDDFKNNLPARVKLSTANSCAMRGFTQDRTYLVEARHETADVLWAYCGSQTRVVDESSDVLRTVRRRARWWNCPLSRISVYRLRRLIGSYL